MRGISLGLLLMASLILVAFGFAAVLAPIFSAPQISIFMQVLGAIGASLGLAGLWFVARASHSLNNRELWGTAAPLTIVGVVFPFAFGLRKLDLENVSAIAVTLLIILFIHFRARGKSSTVTEDLKSDEKR